MVTSLWRTWLSRPRWDNYPPLSKPAGSVPMGRSNHLLDTAGCPEIGIPTPRVDR